MNYYETLYIVHPALEAGRLKDIIIDIENGLKKMGGELLAIELWGKRKLAYFIDKQKYGTYVLIQYNGEGKCTRNFAVELEHNPNILAYLTTHINQDDIIEQKEDLETQIAGKSREVEKIESNIKKERGNSTKIISEDKSSYADGKQAGPKIENEKNNSNVKERDEAEPKVKDENIKDENKLTEKNPTEEVDEPNTINEKE